MNEIQEKIVTLFQSGKIENIELAFELAKGQDFDLQSWVEDQYGELVHCLFMETPQKLVELFTNTELNYAYNYKMKLSEGIGDLNRLEKIDLRGNPIKEFPKSMIKMSNLKSLGLDSTMNYQELLPQAFGLTQLEELQIGGNKMDELPQELFQLSNLKSLAINYMDLKVLPTEVFQLNNLEVLLLDHNQLTEFPKGISKLTKLKELSLSGNHWKEIPKEIAMLPLTYLSLAGIPTECMIPSEIEEMKEKWGTNLVI